MFRRLKMKTTQSATPSRCGKKINEKNEQELFNQKNIVYEKSNRMNLGKKLSIAFGIRLGSKTSEYRGALTLSLPRCFFFLRL